MSRVIVLVRHGETSSNKEFDKRGLTDEGIERTLLLSSKIKRFLKGSSMMFCSNRVRSISTAEILARNLNIGFIKSDEFIIQGKKNISDMIRKSRLLGIKPAKTYIELEGYDSYKIEAPIDLACRWSEILSGYDRFDFIIIVGHEGGLDAFMRFSKSNVLYKSFDEYFGYSDFAVLEIN